MILACQSVEDVKTKLSVKGKYVNLFSVIRAEMTHSYVCQADTDFN